MKSINFFAIFLLISAVIIGPLGLVMVIYNLTEGVIKQDLTLYCSHDYASTYDCSKNFMGFVHLQGPGAVFNGLLGVVFGTVIFLFCAAVVKVLIGVIYKDFKTKRK